MIQFLASGGRHGCSRMLTAQEGGMGSEAPGHTQRPPNQMKWTVYHNSSPIISESRPWSTCCSVSQRSWVLPQLLPVTPGRGSLSGFLSWPLGDSTLLIYWSLSALHHFTAISAMLLWDRNPDNQSLFTFCLKLKWSVTND